ncbi:MAG: hypothetical protein J4F33_01880 [Alphaproteobacteria bacterium]|nr:hypothetical protein [Alphaproteobacteria bacterium]
MGRDEVLALLRARKPVLERGFGVVDLALSDRSRAAARRHIPTAEH